MCSYRENCGTQVDFRGTLHLYARVALGPTRVVDVGLGLGLGGMYTPHLSTTGSGSRPTPEQAGTVSGMVGVNG